ncbi:MAG TPA: dihydrolipoamide acetyltransferase family protein [Burkholderiaceae bacterium]|nr:dihydrolipoamide acetyltransferase family protein [Burkholderiaceae bacterium]
MSEHRIKVPDIGEGIAEVELVAWHVALGDVVAEDQPLADVMTDKATVEVPAPVAGRVIALGGEVGDKLAVGAELLRLETAAPAGARAAPVAAPAQGLRQAEPERPAAPPNTRVDAPMPARPIASPAVRARAWELGIDLAQVKPSGAGGRILQADLDAHAMRVAPALTPAAAKPAPPAAAGTPTQQIRIVGLRRRIAQKMQESKRRIPHFTYVEEVDVGAVEALRAQLNAAEPKRTHLTLLPFIARAIVLALPASPQLNALFDDEQGVLTQHSAVHLGVATQTDAGLMVPVLRNAQARDLWDIATEVARLAAAARAGQAVRAELTGSTITLTSLGALGGIASTPVINHPEVAIVGVNRIATRPVWRDGAVVARPMMNLSSSFDHRVVDGAVAAGFVQRLRSLLEQPALLFVPVD